MSHLDYRAIRARVSIIQVLDLIDYQPTQRRANQWRGPCPFSRLLGTESASSSCPPDPRWQDSVPAASHPSPAASHRCFSVNVSKNIFRCFCCERSGSTLDLWAQLTGKPLYHATVDLCEKLNVQAPLNSQSQNPA